MVSMLRSSKWVVPHARARVVSKLAAVMLVILGVTGIAAAQPNDRHLLNRGDMSPGAIGRRQLMRGGPLVGYFQVVEVQVPDGAQVAFQTSQGYSDLEVAPAQAGMQIGHVYRVRVAGIPYHEGEELFPTIELIDRLYPPHGLERRYPIPIALSQEDLELALAGKFITRVVYLEDPQSADEVRVSRDQPLHYEAGPGTDPLALADTLGRPVAIVRLGGRLPVEGDGTDPLQSSFCAPVQILPPLTARTPSVGPAESLPEAMPVPTDSP